jgi:hypothetical protein
MKKMGKKKSRATQTSKGERRNVSRNVLKAIRREKRDAIGYITTLTEAWLKDQNPWITVPNPNNKETNKRFIKVKANDYWGRPNRFIKWKDNSSE